MGKVEDMRALKAQIREGLARTAVDLPALKAAAKTGKPGKGITGTRAKIVIVDEAASFDLCGHRNMSNRACIRPKDHSEKSHRYPKA